MDSLFGVCSGHRVTPAYYDKSHFTTFGVTPWSCFCSVPDRTQQRLMDHPRNNARALPRTSDPAPALESWKQRLLPMAPYSTAFPLHSFSLFCERFGRWTLHLPFCLRTQLFSSCNYFAATFHLAVTFLFLAVAREPGEVSLFDQIAGGNFYSENPRARPRNRNQPVVQEGECLRTQNNSDARAFFFTPPPRSPTTPTRSAN